MRSGWLQIELLSELCPGTGEGLGGVVDAEIAHEYGLPIIPARRLKGCLREVALELQEYGLADKKVVQGLFGVSGGRDSGALRIEDAHLYEVPSWIAGTINSVSIEDYPSLMRALQEQQQEISCWEVLDTFTLLRTRTALDTGSAKTGSLRTLRTIKRGLILRSRISVCSNSEQSAMEELLDWCVQGLRHLGLGRNRGLGEVRCQLTGMGADERRSAERPAVTHPEQEQIEWSFRLSLETPLIFPGDNGLYHSCTDWIPGGAMLGALAAMYVIDHQLGDNAHEDKDFRRIFLEGGVKFGYAFPEVEGKVFYPCPASWRRVKNEELLWDLAFRDQPAELALRNENKLVCPAGGETIYLHEPKKEVRMHHARNEDRRMARSQGDTSGVEGISPATGRLFQYISLSKGQSFTGTWQGSAGDINLLLECLERRNYKLRLGRSRTAEYGQVSFERGAIKPKGKTEISWGRDSKLVLWLLSPLALCDPLTGRPATDPQYLIDEINTALDSKLTLEQSFLHFGELGGYNSKWRLPKAQRRVLAPGSALVVRGNSGVDEAAIAMRRWGECTGEGCGQIRVMVPIGEELAMRTLEMVAAESPPLPEWLERMHQRNRENQLQGQAALKTEIPVNLNPATIHQIRVWWDQLQDVEQLIQRVKKISQQTKKDESLKFLEPCRGKEKAFIEAYLQNAVWQARKGETAYGEGK